MKIVKGILLTLLFGLMTGGTFWVLAEDRYLRDRMFYSKGHRDGTRECKNLQTGVYLPLGAIEGESLENPPLGYRDST